MLQPQRRVDGISLHISRLLFVIILINLTFSKALILSNNFMLLIGVIIIVKILIHRNHFLNYLILIEVLMIIIYVSLSSIASFSASSFIRVFILIVVIVSGACVGISILVIITRIINKEFELGLLTI